MNIRSALLCIDCDDVFDATESERCPSCSSGQYVALTDYIPALPLNATIISRNVGDGVQGAILPRRSFLASLGSLFG
jgi:hypothetical protein